LSVARFFRELHEGGDVIVGPFAVEKRNATAHDDELEAAIESVDQAWRAELPMKPPPLVMPAAVWAVRMMYRACQLLVDRDVEPQRVATAFAEPCPAPTSTAVCYSADLGLRVLPDVITLARETSPDDPLLTALARQWPLSSVGVSSLKELDVSPFINDPCLRRLYADHIIERNDASRLSDPRAAEAVREALGGHWESARGELTSTLVVKGDE